VWRPSPASWRDQGQAPRWAKLALYEVEKGIGSPQVTAVSPRYERDIDNVPGGNMPANCAAAADRLVVEVRANH
jgi:hypothetical protein